VSPRPAPEIAPALRDGAEQEEKNFLFFEKKQQKTFTPLADAAGTTVCPEASKSFLVLFFKKELLLFRCPAFPSVKFNTIWNILSKHNKRPASL
jgi:hypothetical protein